MGALVAACNLDAGPWDRGGPPAGTELGPRLRTERDLVDPLLGAAPPPGAEQLWSLGELLEALGHRLCDVGRTGHGVGEFVRTADKYRLAVEYWCRAVEATIGEVTRGLAPPQLLDRLEPMAELAPAT
jgi:hypothetical protein